MVYYCCANHMYQAIFCIREVMTIPPSSSNRSLHTLETPRAPMPRAPMHHREAGPFTDGQMNERNTDDNPSFRIETKHVFVCTYGTCNKKYGRVADLRRHHRGAHQANHQFKCRAENCERATRGFSRRDKRDSHEKSMHVKRGKGNSG
ncbi:hypothetical protein GQ44DRAFT_709803 [Phaeosphaeriaceae sp. PMI808]|nr:hypothetical protein GQ44DRAFT_709803 [Phaeosphaeriaceae sp. PMI808]